ncbi:MAG TPA: hypothetical protein VLX58_01450 [Bryobacteraceae bacterium]|nr:hypothetical protein [Bryobacteraceae bacterium]
MRARWLAILLTAFSTAFAGDGEFDHIVKAIESHYGTRHTHIPFMGVANVALKVRHPAGTTDFKMAVFEDLDSSPAYGDHAELDQLMNGLTHRGLHPLVRVHSRNDATYIYMGDAGKSTKLLIATFERAQATVIQVKVNMQTLLQLLNDPEHAADSFGATQDR